MGEKNKNMLMDWKLWIIIATIFIIVLVIALIINDSYKKVSLSSIAKIENTKNEITNEEIIEFAKDEIKKKLIDPETAIFKLKELQRNKGQCLVDIYSISKDKEGNEGRLEFAVRIEENNNELRYIDMGSNKDTCDVDMAEEFEKLMKNCNYEQVYNELFTTNLKEQINLETFKNYKINMYAAERANAIQLADNSILVSFYDSVNRKSYLITIKNGMITKFQQV